MDKFLGINNVDSADMLADGEEGSELRAAKNVDIDNKHGISRRSGFTKKYSGTNCHSLFSNKSVTLFVEDGVLKELNSDYTATTIQTGMARFGRVAYQDINGAIYFTDGNVTGVYNDGTLLPMGIPIPPQKPVLVSSTGILPAGRYGVLFTCADDTGLESGATNATYVDVDDSGAITVTGIPATYPDASQLNIYVTRPDGAEFYKYSGVAFGTASVSITSLPQGAICRTRFKHQMPAGHMMAYHQQRLYVAVDNTVYYSEPYNYGLTDLTKNFIMLPGRVTLMATEPQGMFLSAKGDKTYHVSGQDPDQFSMVVKADYAAIENTAARIDQEVLGEGGAGGESWIWASERGLCAGIIGGSMRNLTKNKYANMTGSIGSAIYRQKDGISQYIGFIHSDDKEANNIYTSDIATAEIRRNGVIIT